MVALPLAHLSWAIADNADRPACDDFFIAVFGAETAFEMLVTPETAHYRFDREERLMVIGDTMLIPIAPAGEGEKPDSGIGTMLRRNARDGQWLGVSLRVADLPAADRWFRERGFQLHYDPGMEGHYFLISRRQALGVRIEIMVGELPNDPRLKPGWDASRWATDHPLGIEGLQAVGVSAPSLEAAREIFGTRLEFPELGSRALDGDDATCAAFDMGDTVIEAMVPRTDEGPLAAHLRDIQGIYCLTFKVRDAGAAARWLRSKGLALTGDVGGRFGFHAFGRTIRFTEQAVPGYPPLGSRLAQPAVFPA